MGVSRQEYWSGLPFPSPGDLPDPGIKRASPALAGGFFTAQLSGEDLSAGKETPKLRATLLEEECHWRLTQQGLSQSGFNTSLQRHLENPAQLSFPEGGLLDSIK